MGGILKPWNSLPSAGSHFSKHNIPVQSYSKFTLMISHNRFLSTNSIFFFVIKLKSMYCAYKIGQFSYSITVITSIFRERSYYKSWIKELTWAGEPINFPGADSDDEFGNYLVMTLLCFKTALTAGTHLMETIRKLFFVNACITLDIVSRRTYVTCFLHSKPV